MIANKLLLMARAGLVKGTPNLFAAAYIAALTRKHQTRLHHRGMETDQLRKTRTSSPCKSNRPFCPAIVCATFVLLVAGVVVGQYAPQLRHPDVAAGETIWKSACVACHGSDGRGQLQTLRQFKEPKTFPDFTRCDQTTAETNAAYKDVILHGGPARGFSQIMPSFNEALTSNQVDDVIAYLRGFCTNPHWPRGELNLPRAAVTEKAYPEDEEVLTSQTNVTGTPGVTTHIIHEQRFGVNNQIEVDVPLQFADIDHTWYGGVGDTTLGVKRVMFSNLNRGSILALQGEISIPTGNKSRGFGTGATTFGTFAAFDQLFRENTWIQTQVGANLPAHTSMLAPQQFYFYTALGQTFAPDHGLGRQWSPMTELLLNRDLINSARNDWDVLPELQVTISRRQHIRGDLGLRIPVTDTGGRSKQLVFYLLWDWQDGSLVKGW